MAIDPRISLAGQPLDVMSSLTRGLAAGENIRNMGVRDAILRQQQQLQQQTIQQQQQAQALQGMQTFGAALQGAMNVPDLAQRAKIWSQQIPALTELGIPESKLRSVDLSNEGLKNTLAQLQPFMAKQQQQATANQRDFMFYQSVINDPTATEEQKQAARIALKVEAPARDFAPKLVELGGVKYMQVGDKLYDPQTFAPVDEQEVIADVVDQEPQQPDQAVDTTVTPAPQPQPTVPEPSNVVGAEAQIEQLANLEARKTAAVEAAKTEAEKERIKQLTPLEVEREREVIQARNFAAAEAQKKIAQQGQKSKIEDANIAYKALKEGNLDRIYGRGEGLFPDFFRSQEGVDLMAHRDQLLGMLTLAARGELKGQGEITGSEQDMLREAVTTLSNPNISPELARQSIDQAMKMLYNNAGMEFNPESTVEEDVDSFLDELFN